MPVVVITFHDGELLYAEVPEITFDLPVLEAEVRNVDSNSQRALIPLTAVRQILVGDVEAAPSPEDMDEWDRAAFHFVDGQVLRARIAPDVRLGRHGGVWRMVEPGGDELRTLAVPYTALKGVFQVRQWDSRSGAERSARAAGEPVYLEQTVRVLAEREARSLPHRPRPVQGLTERIKRAGERGSDTA
jgi:hypothetical protein